MVLYTFLFGAAENHLMHRGGVEYDPNQVSWRLRFHNLAIKHINEEIANLSKTHEPPSDELLACILTLAVYGAQNKTTPLSKSSSALSKAQTLDAVSHRQHVRAHKDALFHLVAKKGGLSNVKMFGISVLIQATDLLWSTLEQRPPNLEWSQGIPFLPAELYEAPSQRLKHQHLATNFSYVPNTTWPTSYSKVIASIRRLMIALDSVAQYGTTETYLQDLVAFRNWTQHCLLSLPSYSSPTQNSTSLSRLSPAGPNARTITTTSQSSAYPYLCLCTLSITRTSLLIFSTFIIFPTPPSSDINTRLNDALLMQLDCCIGHDDWTASPAKATGYAKLIVWGSTLGAINCGAATAAVEAKQKTRFTALLALSSGLLGIGKPAPFAPERFVVGAREGNQATGKDKDKDSGHDDGEASWQELREVLAGFIWCDSALDGLAREVWRDVRLLRKAGAGGGKVVEGLKVDIEN